MVVSHSVAPSSGTYRTFLINFAGGTDSIGFYFPRPILITSKKDHSNQADDNAVIMKLHQATTILSALLAAASSSYFQPASALEFGEFDDPGFSFGNGLSYGYGWNLNDLEQNVGLDSIFLGGVKFSDDGNWVCAVRSAQFQNAAIHCNELVRDPADGRYVSILMLFANHDEASDFVAGDVNQSPPSHTAFFSPA